MKYENYTHGYGAFEIDLNDPIETAKVASIDDAIARARAYARCMRSNQKLYNALGVEPQYYAKIAEENDQLADWLEELKAYRANEGMSENVYKAGYKFGYKKAIDEYTEYLKEIGKSGTDGWVPCFTPNSWKGDFLNKKYNEVTGLENMDIERGGKNE
nr:MAG TPA: hypothetical protein [Bacteriophage sp.]